MRRLAGYTAGTGLVGATVCVAGYVTYLVEAPLPDLTDGKWVQSRNFDVDASAEEQALLAATARSVMHGDRDTTAVLPFVTRLARAGIVSAVAVASKFLLCYANTLEVADSWSTVYTHGSGPESAQARRVGSGLENTKALLAALEKRRSGQGILTVANHVSPVDDPVLLSALLPWKLLMPWHQFERASSNREGDIREEKNIRYAHNGSKDVDDRLNGHGAQRWAICTQEVCFSQGIFLSAFCGLGRVLPIKRGAGVDQPMLLDAARTLAAGHWLHIFPEGKVNQGGELGANFVGVRPPGEWYRSGGKPQSRHSGQENKILQREKTMTHGINYKRHQNEGRSGRNDDQMESGPMTSRRKIKPPADGDGRLKWGVGKVIAHAPAHCRPLIVVPISASGMERMLPVDTTTNMLRPFSEWRLFGQRIEVAVGPAIDIHDLIEAHEARHGALWTYGTQPSEDCDGEGAWRAKWTHSTEQERELYAAITRRVEGALLELERIK
jgi:1-acyl-sn-glycerol-3-phosphate acyltransferase